jgi:hypothetical protein
MPSSASGKSRAALLVEVGEQQRVRAGREAVAAREQLAFQRV